jgi:hypothetical protein
MRLCLMQPETIHRLIVHGLDNISHVGDHLSPEQSGIVQQNRKDYINWGNRLIANAVALSESLMDVFGQLSSRPPPPLHLKYVLFLAHPISSDAY